MPQLEPYTQRDFRLGVIRPSSVNDFLIPPNSTSQSLNVNYDTIIGSAVVRAGTTPLGVTTAIGYAPLGLSEFVTPGSATNIVVGVFKGASNSSLYWFNTTSRNTSNLTSLSNTAKVRFATLAGYAFMANGVVMRSTAGGTTWGTTNCMTTITPSLLYATDSRMLAAGDPTFRNRVWFSSIVSSTAVGAAQGTISWNEAIGTGDWIDINPGDGSDVTALSGSSNTVIVFKSNAMYRLNAITTDIDTQNIFNIGAVSQEAVTICQGLTYFFSGQDIRRTNGGFPEQISRLGVQDFVDAVPQANWSSVCAGTDGFNVYFSIGDVTLNTNQDDQTTYTNVVLKFSARDQSWSIHSYAPDFKFFIQYTTTANGRLMYGADAAGRVQAINLGKTDNGTPIFYELITQDLEFGAKSHTKQISDKLVIFSRYAKDSSIQISADEQKGKDVDILQSSDVSVGKNINATGNSFKLRWFGESQGQAPIFDGFEIPDITDLGISK